MNDDDIFMLFCILRNVNVLCSVYCSANIHIHVYMDFYTVQIKCIFIFALIAYLRAYLG